MDRVRTSLNKVSQLFTSRSLKIFQFGSSVLQGGGSDSKPSAEVVVSWLVDHPDIDFPELSDSESELSSEFIPDSDNEDDDFEDLEGDYEQMLAAEGTPYKKRSDFLSNDEYAIYIRDNIQIGMTVRCCRTYEEVQEGDIGKVVKVSSKTT